MALHCTSTGSLGAAAPKPVFAYFCLAAKVGRARGHEISLGKGVPETHRASGRKTSPGRHCQKENGGRSIPPHPVPQWGQKNRASRWMPYNAGAGDGARTRYLHLGKVALYQMSYARVTMVL